ncbi:MAG TPA: LysR substrate-binding domain-containing protein [Candidatus Competibacteraceae bacterium]|nr:LysR substrate-binding domain-containing protein [Candidatus Competibacteraceae bacterium]
MKNLPMELLRSYVTVAELGGFTSAGNRLGRTQPAISLQVKRLEALVGKPLLKRHTGRKLELTEDGALLLDYARHILALNDEVLTRLTQPRISGCVRLGIPNEFAGSFLPEILGKFAQSHPDVTLNVGCDLSINLLARLAQGEFDLVLALHERIPHDVIEGWVEPLAWVGSPQHNSHSLDPLPLIVAPQGCVYRSRLIQTLESQGREWRIVYSSQSFGGIRAGVMAGLGVTALAARTVPPGLKILEPSERLPPLTEVYARLHYDRAHASEAVLRLVEYMASSARQSPQPRVQAARRRLSRGNGAARRRAAAPP